MYKKKDVILTGFALFAMLFGAGNLIFPPMLGYDLGANWKVAIFAFILTGVGMPLLGLIAAALAGNGFDSFAEKVSPAFAKIYTAALVLAIGPLLAIPRTGATAYELTFYHAGVVGELPKIVYMGIYFLIALFFSLKSTKVVDRIGKILTPVLLVMLSIMLIKGVFFSGSDAAVLVKQSAELPFKKGFIEGYQTMDTLATIVFARIILKSIQNKNNLSKKDEFSFLLKSSIIATIGLAIVYLGLAYLGANIGDTHLTAGAEKTELLTKIVLNILGKPGYVILGLCVAGACLTTTIGLIATVADFFQDLLKISYEKLVVFVTIISFIFALFGVNAIIKLSVPILVFLYPITMALIILHILKIKNHMIFKGTILFTAFVGIYETLIVLNVPVSQSITNVYETLPFSNLGFAWLMPAIVGGVLFQFISKK